MAYQGHILTNRQRNGQLESHILKYGTSGNVLPFQNSKHSEDLERLVHGYQIICKMSWFQDKIVLLLKFSISLKADSTKTNPILFFNFNQNLMAWLHYGKACFQPNRGLHSFWGDLHIFILRCFYMLFLVDPRISAS